jgi:hypothetical protein
MVKALKQDEDWVNAIPKQKTVQTMHKTITSRAGAEDFVPVLVAEMDPDKDEDLDEDLDVASAVVEVKDDRSNYY